MKLNVEMMGRGDNPRLRLIPAAYEEALSSIRAMLSIPEYDTKRISKGPCGTRKILGRSGNLAYIIAPGSSVEVALGYITNTADAIEDGEVHDDFSALELSSSYVQIPVSNGTLSGIRILMAGLPVHKSMSFPDIPDKYSLVDRADIYDTLGELYFIYSYYTVTRAMALLMYASGLSPFEQSDTASGCVVESFDSVPALIQARFHLAGAVGDADSPHLLYIDENQKFIIVDPDHGFANLPLTRHLSSSTPHPELDLIRYVQITLIPGSKVSGAQLLTPSSNRFSVLEDGKIFRTDGPRDTDGSNWSFRKHCAMEHRILDKVTEGLVDPAPWLTLTSRNDAKELCEDLDLHQVHRDKASRFSYVRYLEETPENSIFDLVSKGETLQKVLTGPFKLPKCMFDTIKSYYLANRGGNDVVKFLNHMRYALSYSYRAFDSIDALDHNGSSESMETHDTLVMTRFAKQYGGIRHLSKGVCATSKKIEVLGLWADQGVAKVVSKLVGDSVSHPSPDSYKEIEAYIMGYLLEVPRESNWFAPNSLDHTAHLMLDLPDKINPRGATRYALSPPDAGSVSRVIENYPELLDLQDEMQLDFIPVFVNLKCSPNIGEYRIKMNLRPLDSLSETICNLFILCKDKPYPYLNMINYQITGVSNINKEIISKIISDPIKLLFTLIAGLYSQSIHDPATEDNSGFSPRWIMHSLTRI